MTTALSMPGAGASAGADASAGAGPAPAPDVAVAALTRRQKAAIIVRLMLAEGVDFSLADLPANVQMDLIQQMSELRHVDQATLGAVVDEFLNAFNRTGLTFPGALEDTLALMGDRISPQTSAEMRKRAGLSAHADPWAYIRSREPEVLLDLLARESVEVGAVVLSKLKVTDAADLLGQMPGERARRIAYAVSQTGDIQPQVVQKIGQSLAEQLDVSVERAFEEGPVERVGAILNFSPAATRDEVLDGLEQTDAEFANQVRGSIFTFANIPERVNPPDIARITREVDPAQLVTALAGATGDDGEAAKFILSNMSKRMAESLREEIDELGPVKQKDAEKAMTAVVIAVRELADAGEIKLIEPEEEEE